MKLVRFGGCGIEKPALIDADGCMRDLSVRITDIDDTMLAPRALVALRMLDWQALPLIADGVRLGPVVERAHRILVVDAGGRATSFKGAKPTGAEDAVAIPRHDRRVRVQVALGVIIGSRLRREAVGRAASGIAGYCVAADFASEAIEDREGLTGSAETFAPIGPWLVTADEIEDTGALRWSLRVNGSLRATGRCVDSTALAGIVSTLSEAITLWPGDLLLVHGRSDEATRENPRPVLLGAGDETCCEITGLGCQQQRCEPEDD